MTNGTHNHNHNTRSIHVRRPRIDRALDHPLPLASIVEGNWKSRPKVHRTPRRLATLMTHASEDASGTLLAIAGEEFLVVANTVSQLYIFRLEESLLLSPMDDAVVSPWAVVTLSEDEGRQSAAIVALEALPFGKSLVFGETCRKDEGHVVAFSDDGEGFVIRIRRDGKGEYVVDWFRNDLAQWLSQPFCSLQPQKSFTRLAL